MKRLSLGSIVVRLSLLVSAAILLAATVATWLTGGRYEISYSREKTRQMHSLLSTTAIVIKNPLAADRFDAIEERMIEIVSSNPEVTECFVVDEKGVVVFDLDDSVEGAAFSSDLQSPEMKHISLEVSQGDEFFGTIHFGYYITSVLEEQRMREILRFTRVLANHLGEHLASYKFTEVRITVENMVRDIEDIKFTRIIYRNGEVIFDSGKSVDESTETEKDEETMVRVSGRKPVSIKRYRDEATGENMMDVAALITSEGKDLGVAQIGYSLASLEESIARSERSLTTIAVLFVFLGLAVAVILASRITRPILYLAGVARKIGSGNLDETIDRPGGGNEIRQLAAAFREMISGLRERDLLRDTFSRYVTKQVADEILKDPEKVAPGGKKQTVTVLFSDIRGFTPMSESRAPEDVISQLNEFLSAMVDVIFKHEGTLDKYIGDAIMAVFGSPIRHEDDARRAVNTALEMQERLSLLNEKWRAEGLPELKIGIGLNTGEVIAGNIGDVRRMEYTVIGDPVNIASRLESLTKEYGCGIIIGAQTLESAGPGIKVKKLGATTIKGKKAEIDIFELQGIDNETS